MFEFTFTFCVWILNQFYANKLKMWGITVLWDLNSSELCPIHDMFDQAPRFHTTILGEGGDSLLENFYQRWLMKKPFGALRIWYSGGEQSWQLLQPFEWNTQIHKYKYTYSNTQIQIHKYKYTNTNTQIQIHKYKYTNINTQI